MLDTNAISFALDGLAKSSIKACLTDIKDFATWCNTMELEPLPAAPSTAANYLAHVAINFAASTVQRRAWAINKIHEVEGLPPPIDDPVVARVKSGIRRTKPGPHGKRKLKAAEVKRMIGTCHDGPKGARDKAILALGYCLGVGRELVRFNVADLQFTGNGLDVRGHRTIPYSCMTTALVRIWLEVSGITEGPVFRSVNKRGRIGIQKVSDKVVPMIIKDCADLIGIDPSEVSGNSLIPPPAKKPIRRL